MLLTLTIFTPLLFALICLFVRDLRTVKLLTLTGTLLTFFLSLGLILPLGSRGSMTSLAQECEDTGKIGSLLADLRGNPETRNTSYTENLAREVEVMQRASQSEYSSSLHHIEFVPWIKSFNVNYFLGVDGLGVALIVLTTFLCLVSLGAAWNMDKSLDHHTHKPKYQGMRAFFILYLILETGIIGVFCSMDYLLFYVFWEVVLLPMYFLVGIWGGPRRIYAAIKFFIYTLAGSLLMFIAMLYYYLATDGGHGGTFNVVALTELLPRHFALAPTAGALCFIGLFVAFAVKVPVWPFHTWLPDAHVEAPTPISMLLAGILLKMGGYGLFRFSYMFMPQQAYDMTTVVLVLGSISIVYGAYCALGQTDFKRMVAYSSVSHMGYVLLGMAAMTKLGLIGASFQMINHGISSPMMFALVGVIYERAHHRDLNRFGGIANQMPKYAGMALVGFFASIGLPGLNGFISEALVFFGAFQSNLGNAGDGAWWMVWTSVRFWTVICTLGIVLTAAYLLWGYQRVFYGKMKDPHYKDFKDLNATEWATLVPLAIFCVVLGIFPQLGIKYLDGPMRVLQNNMARHVPEFARQIEEDRLENLNRPAGKEIAMLNGVYTK
ncbi:MAG: NADH-quinone oxidoreductase subunit M [Planctomycetaceae bacterium]|nr:NAD(P)H-quinone oxidoreductase chain 4 [Planctomycetota bacterium]NUO15509.1 NADH-quinone oxidoreductase subunit M [Planctomycetaceae bacterium]HRJ77680.1 NADH-quinone oxidoreductase subunit M [Planctomycetota bacterium]